MVLEFGLRPELREHLTLHQVLPAIFSSCSRTRLGPANAGS